MTPTNERRPWPTELQVRCVDLPALQCSALYGTVDVTAQARWSAADSFRLAMDVPVTASTAVEFPQPGIPRALRHANVYIRADYVSGAQATHFIAPHSYAVDPSQPPVRLAYVSGETFTERVGGAALGGVTIEIVDGAGIGSSVVSRDDNASYMIEFLPVNIPFTARASKAGYVPDVRTHPGIVDDGNGYPSNNFLHFALTPER